MFKQLKEMFRKEEKPPLILATGEIPGWLTVEDSKARKTEKDHVDLSRKNILDSIEKLRELVGFLGSAEHDGAVHPKLEKVVEKSLPLYKKSIMSALTRNFPENPDDFYVAITECIKGCIKSSAGPGRYLIGVFPEEMKAIRASIDHIGREINSMNPVIAEARKKGGELKRIRELHESYLHSREELDQAEKGYPLLNERELALHGEIKAISEEITHLNLDPRMDQLNELHSEENQLKEELERAHGEFSSSGNLIIHVLKRAEKVAQKDRNVTLAKKTRNLAEHLSKSDNPEISLLCQDLNDLLPEVIAMVSHGDISLRNKEEHLYFSNPSLLPDRLKEISIRIDGIGSKLKETRRKIDGNGFTHEKESVDRRYRLKTRELEEVVQSKAALDGRITALKMEIPSLLQQTEDKISAYSGKKASIRQNMEKTP